MVESDTSYDRVFDIQVYLHNLWLEKMASDPLYDDAKINHGLGCRCCSRMVSGESEEMSHKFIDMDTGICKICGQDHSPVTIELEQGGFIITPASAVPEIKIKEKKVPSNILSPDIFWPEEEGF